MKNINKYFIAKFLGIILLLVGFITLIFIVPYHYKESQEALSISRNLVKSCIRRTEELKIKAIDKEYNKSVIYILNKHPDLLRHSLISGSLKFVLIAFILILMGYIAILRAKIIKQQGEEHNQTPPNTKDGNPEKELAPKVKIQ